MNEPVYNYVKGKGWVPNIGYSRDFTFKGKTWRMVKCDAVEHKTRSWLTKTDLFALNDSEFQDYVDSFFSSKTGPGVDVGFRRAVANTLYAFYEI